MKERCPMGHEVRRRGLTHPDGKVGFYFYCDKCKCKVAANDIRRR